MVAGSLVPRSLTPTVLDAMASARVVALLGPRQAGKSTLASLICVDELRAEFISLLKASLCAPDSALPSTYVSNRSRARTICRR